MSTMNRRQALLSLLGGALQAAGAVVLASSALPAVAGQVEPGQNDGDLQERADRLSSGEGELCDEHEFCAAWVNGGFRRGGFANGGFRNGGGWRNGGGGGFRNGGFGNGGGFRKGGWRNY